MGDIAQWVDFWREIGRFGARYFDGGREGGLGIGPFLVKI